MREILFRGFQPDENGSKTITWYGDKIKGEWVYGAYDFNKEHKRGFIVSVGIDSISPIAYIKEVIPETVGQWTGLTDKNKVKIFQDDIGCWRSNKRAHTVSFEKCRFKIEDYYGNEVTPTQEAIDYLEFEVIGNKWEVEQ